MVAVCLSYANFLFFKNRIIYSQICFKDYLFIVRKKMKNIVLICDIDVKKGSSFFDFLIQLPQPNKHFILFARSISDDAYAVLKSKSYTYSSFSSATQLFALFLRYRPHIVHFHFMVSDIFIHLFRVFFVLGLCLQW